MTDIDARLAELRHRPSAKRAFRELAALPLSTKREVVYPELVRLAATALDPAAPSYEAAETYLAIVAGELGADRDLVALLCAAMKAAAPATGVGAPVGDLFRRFVARSRDPRGLARVAWGNGLDREELVVALDAGDEADALVAELEAPITGHYFYGIGAVVHAGARVRPLLTGLYERTFSTSRAWVAVAIAIAGDPADAAWFKALPTSGEYANAKRLHLAFTARKPKDRLDAIEKLTKTLDKQAFYGTLVGLVMLLASDVPEVVERAAIALASHAKSRNRLRETTHDALFVRFARGAVQRGVTPGARTALDAVMKTIPWAPPLPAAHVVRGELGDVPVKAPAKKRALGPSPHAAVTAADDAIVRAILDSPEDDAPRLVLADRLTERGDPRGEFIQIQCALGRLIEGARGYVPVIRGASDEDWAWLGRENYITKDVANRAELEAREAELYKKHLKQWLEPVRSFVRTFSWRRGFLHHVDAPAAAFLDGAATLLSAHPVAVTIEKLDKHALARLRDAPLHGLRSLDVRRIQAKQIDALLGENLRGLERLGLIASPIGDAGARRLASDSSLGSLRRLSLVGSDVGDVGLRAIAESHVLGDLEMIDVRRTAITSAGLRALIESRNLRRLTHVRLGVDASDPGAAARFDRETVEALAKSLRGRASDDLRPPPPLP